LHYQLVSDPEAAMRQCSEDANRAIAIDQRDYLAHYALGRLLLLQGNHAGAIQELELTITINPSYAMGYLGLAMVLSGTGDYEKSLEHVNQSIQLSPNDPRMWAFLALKAVAYRELGQLEKAIETYQIVCRSPAVQHLPLLGLAAAYVEAGRLADAAAPLRRARKMQPRLSVEFLKVSHRYLMPEKALGRMIENLRQAGLPDN
jgi:tetratricopeptide (TPR) repeat protein